MAFERLKRLFDRSTKADPTRMPRSDFYYRGGIRVSEDPAMQVSAFNRGVIYISTQIAKLPWEIKDAKNEIQSNAVANLLGLAPNEEMNAFQFRCWAIQQAIIHGNSYAEIERNFAGTPIAIWPIPTSNVELVRSSSGSLAYKVSGASSPHEAVYLQPRDVYHTRNFHTKDGLLGQGVVAFAKETLGITLAADQMASGIFNNGGIPSGVLSHPGAMSDEAYERLKKSWAEQHGGRRTGGTSILEEGTTYSPVNVPPEALQFLQSRQFGVLEIARFLGVPPTKLFDVTAATFSNVENANLEVATDTLDSWACNLEMEADVKILNNRYGGRYSELDLYSVFRGDMTTRSNYFKSMMGIAAITPNEIRAREGMAPYKEGKNYYIATNNFTPVDRMNEVIDAQISQKTKPATDPQPAKDPGAQDLTKAAVKFLLK